MDYLSLKHFHMGCAALSGTLFLLRGKWMLRASPMLEQKWVRIVLGSVALKRGRTCGQRTAALVTALAVFLYILPMAGPSGRCSCRKAGHA